MGLKEDLQGIFQEKKASKEALEAAAEVLATAIAEKLAVIPEEVAILVLTTTQKSLKFIWPPPLFKSGSVLPVSHKSAIAATVLSTRKGKVDNKISESKHLRFFENIRGMETSGLPIQKMVALPLMVAGRPIGVLEISRKGRTPEAAGPDFTAQDAQTLVGLSREATPLLAKMIPDPFL